MCFRPYWLPAKWLAALLRCEMLYLALCHTAPFALMLGGVFEWRRVACVAFWSYALLESSLSHWHRHLATCYITAFMLADERWARVGAAAVSAHIMFSSGAAKLAIGGLKWHTSLGPVLRTYSVAGWPFGPAWPAAAIWLQQRPMLLHACGIATLCFEAAFPLLLLFGVHRHLLFVASCGLHVAITAVQSLGVGFAFLAPHTVIYALAFGKTVPPQACALAGVSVARFFIFGISSRDFPASPFALFAWSLDQWTKLHQRFVDGRHRIVLGVHPPATGDTFIQCFYSHTLGPALEDRHQSHIAYDAWERIVGETLVYKPLLQPILNDLSRKHASVEFLEAIAAWLSTSTPLVEVKTGHPLLYAAYVKLYPDLKTIAHVIHSAPNGDHRKVQLSRAIGD